MSAALGDDGTVLKSEATGYSSAANVDLWERE